MAHSDQMVGKDGSERYPPDPDFPARIHATKLELHLGHGGWSGLDFGLVEQLEQVSLVGHIDIHRIGSEGSLYHRLAAASILPGTHPRREGKRFDKYRRGNDGLK